jgi:uncharacterized protein YegL
MVAEESGHDALARVAFADNPEPRCAVVLVLDTSGSMDGRPIQELNRGLAAFATALNEDRLASLRVELALVTFGGKVRALDVGAANGQEIPFDAARAFVTADAFRPPLLAAGGETPMGDAVNRGLALIKARKDIYRTNGIDYFRPWLFLLSDGQPTDRAWEGAAQAVRDEESRRGVSCYAVAVEGADLGKLARFSGQRAPLKLKGLAFGELFQWLSRSLSAVSQSKPGEQVPLPPVGWADIDTAH